MGAALFHAAGIPTVNYGPGGAGAHEAVEWVEFVRRARGAKPLLGNVACESARTCSDGPPLQFPLQSRCHYSRRPNIK
jgi:hypothetical protein